MLFLRECEDAAREASRRGVPLGVIALSIGEGDEARLWTPLDAAIFDTVSQKLRERLRPGCFSSQFGSTIFIVLPGTGEEETAAFGRRLVERGLDLYLDGTPMELSASAGAATVVAWSDASRDLRDAFSRAVAALHLAWRRGSASFTMHSIAFDRQRRRENCIGRAIANALHRGEFTLNYQPIVDVIESRVVAVEALMRWKHPSLGGLMPDEFVPLAERLGYARGLDEYALTAALVDFPALRDALGDVKLHVNISPEQLWLPAAAQTLLAIVASSKIDPGDIVLEVTESARVEPLDGLVATLERLRCAGVRIAIDDLGAGFNSFQFFANITSDVVKIDRTVVPLDRTDERRKAMLDGVMRVCSALRLDQIVEGVETREQHELVLAAGGRLAQGFRYGFPVAPELIAGLYPQGKVQLAR